MDYNSAETEILKDLQQRLPADYHFHNLEHTRDVVAAVAFLAEKCACTKEETLWLKTAALCHDTGYMVKDVKNEEIGADYARKKLPAYGYSEADLQIICRLILATSFPYNPKERLEYVICDADLYYILTDRFAVRAELLRREFAGRGHKYNDQEWYNLEKNFLNQITFYTDYARGVYAGLKPGLLDKIERTFRSITHE